MARILITEDDDSVRTFVRRALELDGHAVIEASDGVHAMEALTNLERGFDLLVSDITMPEMDGIALAHAARARLPELPIVLMTGYADQREAAEDLRAVIQDLVMKPFTLSDIRRAVGRALAGGGRRVDAA